MILAKLPMSGLKIGIDLISFFDRELKKNERIKDSISGAKL